MELKEPVSETDVIGSPTKYSHTTFHHDILVKKYHIFLKIFTGSCFRRHGIIFWENSIHPFIYGAVDRNDHVPGSKGP